LKTLGHSRVGGNPEAYNYLKTLDSRFHWNDKIVHISTFYEFIILNNTMYRAFNIINIHKNNAFVSRSECIFCSARPARHRDGSGEAGGSAEQNVCVRLRGSAANFFPECIESDRTPKQTETTESRF
jgi:hypothetical protein